MTKEKYKLNNSKTIRLSDSVINNIAYMVDELKISESELLRSIIEKAIDEYKLKKALFAMETKNISLSEGANIAGLSYKDFYDKVIESKILTKLDGNDTFKNQKDYDKHIKSIQKLVKKNNSK